MLYDDTAYDPAIWPESYWRASTDAPDPCPALEGTARADVAIIGSGYAGLNAALELVERFGLRVTVLEAAQPGWGASGRNGGFCCLGGARLSAGAITRRLSAGAARDWAAYERAAIARVADNLARYGIDARVSEPGDLYLAASARDWARMRAEAGPDARVLDARGLREEGFDTAVYHGGILGRGGFGLHPFAYVTGLARAARQAGVVIHGDSRVIRVEPQGGGWALHTAQGRLEAGQVLVATNGYSDERLTPWLGRRILPVISNIMVTRPLSGAELQAQGWTRSVMAHDSRTLLHYFRLLPEGRMMFGARGGVSTAPEPVARFARRARASFETIFPRLAQAETAYRWNGLICLTGSRAPYIGPVPGADGLWLSLGWHGNGVAAASEGGRRAAGAMMGATGALPALVRRAPARFPVPRRLALAGAMALAALRDGPVRPR